MADASPKPPKWRLTRTPRQGYLLAAVWLIIGVTQLAAFWGGGSVSRWLMFGVGLFGTILGAGYLLTTLAVRRREQRLSASASGPKETRRL
jgi:hypothetical protein